MTSDRNENDPWKPCPMDDSPTLFPIRQPFGQPGFLDACGVSAQRLHDWASAGLLSFDFSEAGQLEPSYLAEVHVDASNGRPDSLCSRAQPASPCFAPGSDIAEATDDPIPAKRWLDPSRAR